VLEIGCGDGSIWRANVERTPPGWRLTLTDFSPGMVDAAAAALGARADYAAADARSLPFGDASFDAVIANHVLFHLPERERALAEIRRVLRPGGALVGTTVGRGHLQELRDLQADRENVFWRESPERFGLETAAPQLERFFVDVAIEPFPDSLAVTETEPLVDFVRSLQTPGLDEDDLAAIEARVQGEIDRSGSFHVTKAIGRFRARKP
jgi:SAM-dependent methyltransferase